MRRVVRNYERIQHKRHSLGCPMRIKVTRDNKGVAAWPADTRLAYSDGVYFDRDCMERGIENLWDLFERVVGEGYFVDHPQCEVTVEITLLSEVKASGIEEGSGVGRRHETV